MAGAVLSALLFALWLAPVTAPSSSAEASALLQSKNPDDPAAAEVPEPLTKRDQGKSDQAQSNASDGKSSEKPVDKSAGKPGEKPVDKTAGKPGEKPVDKTAGKPGEKSFDKSAGKPGEKPVDKSAGKPGEKPVDKSAGKPGEKSFDKTAGKPGDKNAPGKNPKSEVSKGDGSKGDVNKGDGSKSEGAKSGSKTAHDEAALAFARQHHPELADLLVNLKKGNPNEYGRAIKELMGTVERLSKMREKAPERYDLAVAAWTLDSKIRLLSARLVMADNPALETELKALLQQRREHRLAEMKQEREKVAARLKRLETDIAALEADPAAGTQKELLEVQSRLKEKAREFRKKPGKSGTTKDGATKDGATKDGTTKDGTTNKTEKDAKPEPPKGELNKGDST